MWKGKLRRVLDDSSRQKLAPCTSFPSARGPPVDDRSRTATVPDDLSTPSVPHLRRPVRPVTAPRCPSLTKIPLDSSVRTLSIPQRGPRPPLNPESQRPRLNPLLQALRADAPMHAFLIPSECPPAPYPLHSRRIEPHHLSGRRDPPHVARAARPKGKPPSWCPISSFLGLQLPRPSSSRLIFYRARKENKRRCPESFVMFLALSFPGG